MIAWRRAVGFGMMAWAIPFAFAVALGPVKLQWRTLFESIMPVVVAGTAVLLALLYFRRTATPKPVDGLKVGLLWATISVLVDLPLMLSPPLSTSPVEYLADVGVAYLIMPIVTVGLAVAFAAGSRPASE